MSQQAVVSLPSKWTPRQIILATIFVVAIVLAFLLLFRFRAVIFILFVGILISTATKPAVRWLAGRGLSRVASEILVYSVLVLAVTGFLLLTLPLILEQSTVIVQQLSGYYQQLRDLMLQSPSTILHQLGFRLAPDFQMDQLVQNPQPTPVPAPPTGPLPQAQSPEPAASTALVSQVFTYLSLVSRSLFTMVAIFLIGFYWTLEGDRAVRSILLLFPKTYRENVRDLIEASEEKLGGFLLGEGLLMLSIAVMSLVAYLLIGLPNALVLALIAGVMEAVPTIGPVLGALPAVLIAASQAPEKIPWVIAAAVIIQLSENNLLVPRIMDKSVGVNPLLTILSFAAFSSLFGLWGALLAVPLAAILQLVLNRMMINAEDSTSLKPEGRDYLSYLRLQAQEIVQDTRKRVRTKDQDPAEVSDQLEDTIEALASELDRVLAQAAPQESKPA